MNTILLLRQKVWLQIFTVYLRYLIGGAFIIAAFGMGKIRGQANLLWSMDSPFEELEPIQRFFRVMVESGLYWQFIGWSQIISGMLLMSQRFSKVGALIFLGLILNIFVITLSYDFRGTPVVTGLMLLATTYLLIWDYPFFQPLIANHFPPQVPPLDIAHHPFWIWLGMIMIGSIVTLSFYSLNLSLLMGVPFLEGLIGFFIFFIRRRRTALV